MADDIVFGATWAAELGVLLVPHHSQMGTDQPHEQNARHKQDVHDIQPGNQTRAWEFSPEHEIAKPGADHGYRLDDRIHDPKSGAGEQIVG